MSDLVPPIVPASLKRLLLKLGCAALIHLAAGSFAAAAAETLVVKVSGLKPGAGLLQVMVWKDAGGFPTDFDRSVARKGVPVTGARLEVSFAGLAQGVYAVAVYQDLNGNGRLDRSVLGWPTEPTGASNGATGSFGPPKFRDAAFELNQPLRVIEVTVK